MVSSSSKGGHISGQGGGVAKTIHKKHNYVSWCTDEYSETCLQEAPHYPRESVPTDRCPFITGSLTWGKIGRCSWKVSPDQSVIEDWFYWTFWNVARFLEWNFFLSR